MKPRSRFVRFASLAALGLFTAAAVTASTRANADVIRLDSDSTTLGVDPAADFDVDCLGPTPAEDCDARAALLEGELVSILAQLENDTDPRTLPIFEQAVDLDSPLVQTMAMRYLARADQQPTDFLSKVRTFFLGPDAPLGVSAAEVLRDSADETDQTLSELYRQERTASDYAPTSTPATDPDATNDDLVMACTKDARLNTMASFAEEDRFSPAERLLMYDRFISSFVTGTDYPVTSFVTDASVEEVSAFFTQRFGKSYGPYGEAQTHYQELTLELVGLQAAAQKGDQAAIARLQQIGEELQSLQDLITLGSSLQLPTIHAENDLVWIDGNVDDLLSNPSRAVTVGADASLGKTVIRYINAPQSSASGGVGGAGGVTGAGGRPAGGRSSTGGAAGSAGAAGSSGSKDDSGCGCSIPGAPSPHAGLLGLIGAALVAMRLRRRRRE